MPLSDHGDFGLGRIALFSDAVIAIAITLLVIDLKLPSAVDGEKFEFSQLQGLSGHAIAFVNSFFTIGSFWDAHHRMLLSMRTFDRAFVWINLVFLFLVAALPFPTSILGEHIEDRDAIVLYTIAVAAIACARLFLWRHASYRQRLLRAETSETTVSIELWRAAIVAGGFTLTIAVAYWLPSIAPLTWLAIFIVSQSLQVLHRQFRPRRAD